MCTGIYPLYQRHQAIEHNTIDRAISLRWLLLSVFLIFSLLGGLGKGTEGATSNDDAKEYPQTISLIRR